MKTFVVLEAFGRTKNGHNYGDPPRREKDSSNG
jgi:hypothetical protein